MKVDQVDALEIGILEKIWERRVKRGEELSKPTASNQIVTDMLLRMYNIIIIVYVYIIC